MDLEEIKQYIIFSADLSVQRKIVNKLIEIFRKDPAANINYREFVSHSNFDLLPETIIDIERCINKAEFYNAFNKFFISWVGKTGSKASFKVLLETLQDIDWKSVIDSIASTNWSEIKGIKRIPVLQSAAEIQPFASGPVENGLQVTETTSSTVFNRFSSHHAPLLTSTGPKHSDPQSQFKTIHAPSPHRSRHKTHSLHASTAQALNPSIPGPQVLIPQVQQLSLSLQDFRLHDSYTCESRLPVSSHVNSSICAHPPALHCLQCLPSTEDRNRSEQDEDLPLVGSLQNIRNEGRGLNSSTHLLAVVAFVISAFIMIILCGYGLDLVLVTVSRGPLPSVSSSNNTVNTTVRSRPPQEIEDPSQLISKCTPQNNNTQNLNNVDALTIVHKLKINWAEPVLDRCDRVYSLLLVDMRGRSQLPEIRCPENVVAIEFYTVNWNLLPNFVSQFCQLQNITFVGDTVCSINDQSLVNITQYSANSVRNVEFKKLTNNCSQLFETFDKTLVLNHLESIYFNCVEFSTGDRRIVQDILDTKRRLRLIKCSNSDKCVSLHIKKPKKVILSLLQCYNT